MRIFVSELRNKHYLFICAWRTVVATCQFSVNIMKKNISNLNDFCNYLNSCNEWPLEANSIIEENGWEDLTGTSYGICSDGENKIVLEDNGTYSVIANN